MKVSNKVTENGRVTAKLVLNVKKVKEKVFSVQRETVCRKNYLFLNYMASHELQGSS